jgi:hypothetical protein
MPPQPPKFNGPGARVPLVLHKASTIASSFEPPATPQQVMQRGKDRVNTALSMLRTGVGSEAQGFLEVLMAGGEEGQELTRQIAARAQKEIAQRKHLCTAISELLAPFQAPNAKMQFVREVILHARTQRATSQETSNRIDKFFPLVGSVLQFAESRLGPLTVGFGFGVQGGVSVGLQGAIGVAGLRHHSFCLFDSSTRALGTFAEMQGSLVIGVSEGTPEAGYLSGWEGLAQGQWPGGLTIDASLSASYNFSAEGTISLQPVKIHRPSWNEPYVVEFKCVGMALSLGVGAPGGGVSLGLSKTSSRTLVGTAS